MNTYQHPDADALVTNVGKIIKPLTDLVRRARDSDDVDLVYVNDNFGDFTAQFSDIVHSACHGERPDLVEPIVPTHNSRVVTKVRHSAFYSTRVAYLLNRLGAERVILTAKSPSSASSTARSTPTYATSRWWFRPMPWPISIPTWAQPRSRRWSRTCPPSSPRRQTASARRRRPVPSIA